MTNELFKLIAVAPLISLVCVAVHACVAWEGMILHFLHRWYTAAVVWILEKKYGPDCLYDCGNRSRQIRAWFEYLAKPFYACLICMSSVWSIAAWIVLYGAPTFYTLLLILFVCGINVILDSLIYKLRS